MLKYLLSVFVILTAILEPRIYTFAVDSTDVIVLEESNSIVINEPIMGDSVAKASQQLRDLDSQGNGSFGKKKPVYLFLYTPGGSIQDGLEFIEVVRGLDRPVYTITAFAASMGFQIVQNLGKRLVLKNGILMSHKAKGGIEGEFGGSLPTQLDSRYKFWLQRILELDLVTVTRTEGRQTLESYQKSYASELWLTGDEAVKLGYADKVVAVRCGATLAGMETRTANFMGFKVLYDISKCPMNAAPTNVRIANAGENTQMNEHIKELFTSKFIDLRNQVIKY